MTIPPSLGTGIVCMCLSDCGSWIHPLAFAILRTNHVDASEKNKLPRNTRRWVMGSCAPPGSETQRTQCIVLSYSATECAKLARCQMQKLISRQTRHRRSQPLVAVRSEERRVGKECRVSEWEDVGKKGV